MKPSLLVFMLDREWSYLDMWVLFQVLLSTMIVLFAIAVI